MIARLVKAVLESEMFKGAVQREVAKQLPIEMQRQRLGERAVLRVLSSGAANEVLDRKLAETLEDSRRQ